MGLGLGAVAAFGAGMVHISAVVQGFKTLRDFFRGFTWQNFAVILPSTRSTPVEVLKVRSSEMPA